MSAPILGVHGILNWGRAVPADRAVELARDWGAALGLDSIAVAYYAHHLRFYHQGADDDLDQLDHSLNGQPNRLLSAWMRSHGWREEPTQGWALAPIRQLASWWVQRYGLDHGIVDRFLSAFLREVVLYFDLLNPTRRHAVRTEVATAISAHRPRIVIAHSLGSVVTYETLWAYPLLRVELLITIGSPLALPDRIHPVLQPPPINGKGRRPPGVRRWINISDPADLVAIPAGLANHFHHVDADLVVPAGPMFTHAATAYLSSQRLHDVITTHLATPSPTR